MSLLLRATPPAPPRGRGVQRAGVLTSVVVAGAAAATLFVLDPYEAGHYPTCPFLALTGWWCPGCGALRALHDLLHGDPGSALARNPLVVLAVPYVLVAGLGWLRSARGRPTLRSTALPVWAIWLLLGVVLTFGVLRNLPGWTWLSPA